MASEIRVDKINSLSGVGTVTLSPTGVDIAGITTAATLRATTGIVTSLTAGSLTSLSDVKVGSGVTLSPDGDVSITGVITATEFHGNGANLNSLPAGQLSGSLPAINGSALLGVARTDNIRTNTNATFLQNVNVSGSTTTGSVLVGSGITLSSDGHAFVAGIATVGRQIVGISTNNLVPFLFNNYSDLPSASDYHGQFAHVHVAGKAFYAHAGAWYQLVNVGSELTVGLGTEKYNVGILTATTVKVGSVLHSVQMETHL